MPSRYGHQPFLPGIELWTQSRSELLSYLEKRINDRQTSFIITLNPLMIMERSSNKEFNRSLETADVIVADGRGVRWAARKIGKINPPLIPGVELAEELIRYAAVKGLPVSLIGAHPGVWEKAKENLSKKYPGLNIVAGHHGYFKETDEAELIDRLASHKPLLIIAGMGFPRQEIFLYKYKGRFPGAILIGVGGSLDIYSGVKKRAPVFFRKTGTEWLWRMLTEPSRIKRFWRLLKFWLWVKFYISPLPKNGV